MGFHVKLRFIATLSRTAICFISFYLVSTFNTEIYKTSSNLLNFWGRWVLLGTFSVDSLWGFCMHPTGNFRPRPSDLTP